MNIKCQLEPADLIAAQYLQLRPRASFKWLGLFIIALFLFVGVYALIAPSDDQSAFLPFLVLGLPLYLGIFFCLWIPYNAKKIYKQQKTIHQPYEATITEESFQSTIDIGSGCIPWKDFHKYKVGKKYILVYQSDLIFYIFPKRWFKNEEYQKFLSYLRASLGAPKP